MLPEYLQQVEDKSDVIIPSKHTQALQNNC